METTVFHQTGRTMVLRVVLVEVQAVLMQVEQELVVQELLDKVMQEAVLAEQPLTAGEAEERGLLVCKELEAVQVMAVLELPLLLLALLYFVQEAVVGAETLLAVLVDPALAVQVVLVQQGVIPLL